MQLDGTLDTFPLAELIAMIVGSSVTGVLQIGRGGAVGQLYCRDGRLYHAMAGDAAGYEAVVRMFEEHDAPFCFEAGVTAPQQTLWQDPWDLIASAERQAELWRSIRPFVPSLDCIPYVRERSGGDAACITEEARPVIASIDGRCTVGQIAHDLGYVPVEVAGALCSLIQQGVVGVRMPTGYTNGHAEQNSRLLQRLRPAQPSEPAAQHSRPTGSLAERIRSATRS